MIRQKYSELEAMAKKFREDELKTTSGLWMSTLFYGACGEINNSGGKDFDHWIGLAKSLDSWMEYFPTSPTPYIAKSII